MSVITFLMDQVTSCKRTFFFLRQLFRISCACMHCILMIGHAKAEWIRYQWRLIARLLEVTSKAELKGLLTSTCREVEHCFPRKHDRAPTVLKIKCASPRPSQSHSITSLSVSQGNLDKSRRVGQSNPTKENGIPVCSHQMILDFILVICLLYTLIRSYQCRGLPGAMVERSCEGESGVETCVTVDDTVNSFAWTF